MAAGCTNEDSVQSPRVEKQSQPLWANGGFESDAIGAVPSSWTVTPNLNPDITIQDPQTLAGLNLAPGGTAATYVVGGATESQTDPAAAPVRYPKFGTRTALLNFKAAPMAVSGALRNVNTLSQQMTLSAADIDPADSQLHVRFVLAPVLQNPSHTPVEQPYYFVELRNVTQNAILYQDFQVSAQPGVPWQNAGTVVNPILFTDWQLVDVVPTAGNLTIGDTVEIKVVAAGCSQGGHWGRVYVDGFGPVPPGLFAIATAPSTANAGTDISYVVRYRNGGAAAASGTAVDFVTPPNTTFKAVSSSGTCTAPAIGAAGTVSCNVGMLAAGGSGTLTVTVTIAAAATGKITQGNYSVRATGVSPLLGSHTVTTITNPNVGITVSSGLTRVAWGQPITYTIIATNSGAGPAPAVTLTDTMPPELQNVTWTCVGSGGGSCTASGSGSISDAAVVLPAAASVTYTVTASVIAGVGNSSTTHTAAALLTSGGIDSDPANNSASETILVRPLRTLTLTKNAAGSVSSSPSGIACLAGCTSTTGPFVEGATITLTAITPTMGQFLGWGGACSGLASTCMVTIAGNQTVTAGFAGPAVSTTVSSGSGQKTNVSTAFPIDLDVLVLDSFGDPVPNQSVVFSAPVSGASAGLSSLTALTNSTGHARVTATANTIPGAYKVSGTLAGAAAEFDLSNLGPPAVINVLSGSGQQISVGAAATNALVVEVRDAANQVLEGIAVTFGTPTSGASGMLSATAVNTDSAGRASVNLTGGTLTGAYVVTAAVSGVSMSGSFAVTNVPGPATTIATSAGAAQQTVVAHAFASALDVRVTDALGNPVPNAWVTFAVPNSAASATLSTYGLATDANGHAIVHATANSMAGAYSVTASVPGVGTPATFSLVNLAGPPASIVAVAASAKQSAQLQTAFAAALSVVVSDAFGNPVNNANVTYTVPGSEPSAALSDAVAHTDSAGRASVTAAASSTPGIYIVTAMLDDNAGQADFTLTNTVSPVPSLTVVAGSPASAVVTTAFSARLEVLVTLAGNPLANTVVTFAAPPSGASASLAANSVVTDAAGHAVVEATAGSVSGSYTVTASVSNASQGAQFALTNTPGAPAKLVTLPASTPQVAQVGRDFGADLAVLVLDAHDNPVPGVTVTFTVPSSGSSAVLDALTVTTDAHGQASVGATANGNVGSYVISASVSGVASAAMFALSNSSTGPLTLAIDSGSPQSATVDSAFAQALQVKVTDPSGAPVQNARVMFTPPSAGATAVLSASSVLTNANGLAQTSASASQTAGSYDLIATVDGAAAGVRFNLPNTPGAPVAISASPGSTPQSARISSAYRRPLSVIVVDSFGNPVPGVAVEFSTLNAAAAVQLTSSPPTTSPSGEASVTAIALKKIGPVTVTATVSGTQLSVTFQLNNSSGEPATLMLTEGGDQTGLATQPFAKLLKVVVRDAEGNPVSGAKVQTSINGAGPGATLSAAELTTNDEGEAALQVTANDRPGQFTLTLTVQGALAPVITTFTIEPIATSTTLALVPTEANSSGAKVTLTATVTSQHGTPSGEVQFFVNTKAVGTAQLSGGKATFEFTTTSAGANEVQAIYTAQGPFAESRSEARTLTVSDVTNQPADAGAADGGETSDAGRRPSPSNTIGWKLSGGGCSLAGNPHRDSGALFALLLLLGCSYFVLRRARRD
jgi:uncharacterized repeat protein (TIGR01451 family)